MLSSRSAPADIDQDQKNFVTAEFSRLCQDPVDGIYCTPLSMDFLTWKGFLMVREGCYSGGTFRFSLILPGDFPHSKQLPKVLFDTLVFHPYIDTENCELNLRALFPDGLWHRDYHKVIHVIHYLQEVFAILTENFPLDNGYIWNENAATLFARDFDNFRLKAEDIVAMSRHLVYDAPDCSDPHLIIFTPWEEAKMEPIRRQLIGRASTTAATSCSRTASDFSSRTASNDDGDADDEQQLMGFDGSPNSDQSFDEAKLRRFDFSNDGTHLSTHPVGALTNEFSDLSSIDLESQPPSARDSLMETVENGENDMEARGFEVLDVVELLDETAALSNDKNTMSRFPDAKECVISHNSTATDLLVTLPTATRGDHYVAFRLGGDDSSAAELTDEAEPQANAGCVVMPSDEPEFLDMHSDFSTRGADVRSVSVFSDSLQ